MWFNYWMLSNIRFIQNEHNDKTLLAIVGGLTTVTTLDVLLDLLSLGRFLIRLK